MSGPISRTELANGDTRFIPQSQRNNMGIQALTAGGTLQTRASELLPWVTLVASVPAGFSYIPLVLAEVRNPSSTPFTISLAEGPEVIAGAGLPAGGNPGDLIVNTGPGAGSWSNATTVFAPIQAQIDGLDADITAIEITNTAQGAQIAALQAGQTTQDTAIVGLQDDLIIVGAAASAAVATNVTQGVDIAALQAGQTTQDTAIAARLLIAGHAGFSVVGRAASGTGGAGDIVASVDGQSLVRRAAGLVFETLSYTAGTIAYTPTANVPQGDVQAAIAGLGTSRAGASTQIIAGTGLTGGGDLSASRTLALTNTSVAPGTYGNASNVGQFVVDAQGRVTSAVNIPLAGGGAVTSVYGRSGAVVAVAGDYTAAQVSFTPTAPSTATTVQGAVSERVLRVGDTMTGALNIFPALGVAAAIELVGNGANAYYYAKRFQNTNSASPILLTHGRGTATVPQALISNDETLRLQGFYYDGSAERGSVSLICYMVGTPSPTDARTDFTVNLGQLGGFTSETLRLTHLGAMAINNTTRITAQGLLVRPVYTIATLPAGQPNGATAIVTNSASAVLGTIVAAGGSTRVPVNFDGTNWRIG